MINKETAKKVALGTAVGLVAGVVIGVVISPKFGLVLKAAKWSPDGDMLLWFYGRDNHLIIPSFVPKPE